MTPDSDATVEGSGMKLLLSILLAVSISACGWAYPDAGTEAVLVRKPFIFGHGGIDRTPIKAGRTLVAISTQVIYVDMRPMQFHVQFDDLMSRDGVPLDFDAVIRVQVTDSAKLIEKFGPEWFPTNVEREMSNRVRQAVRKHGLNETAIDTTAIEAIDTEITEGMRAYLTETDLPLRLIAVTVGKANPPESVKHQRVETAQQEQRQNTEKQRKLAEDQRKMAEESRATADNAYRQQMSLSPDQFLRLETIKMQRDVCAGGKCTFLLGGSAIPTFEVQR
jgi:hypothetical protein